MFYLCSSQQNESFIPNVDTVGRKIENSQNTHNMHNNETHNMRNNMRNRLRNTADKNNVKNEKLNFIIF